MVRIVSSLLLASLASTFAWADTIKCDANNQCPEKYPCCSREFSSLFEHSVTLVLTFLR